MTKEEQTIKALEYALELVLTGWKPESVSVVNTEDGRVVIEVELAKQ